MLSQITDIHSITFLEKNRMNELTDFYTKDSKPENTSKIILYISL